MKGKVCGMSKATFLKETWGPFLLTFCLYIPHCYPWGYCRHQPPWVLDSMLTHVHVSLAPDMRQFFSSEAFSQVNDLTSSPAGSGGVSTHLQLLCLLSVEPVKCHWTNLYQNVRRYTNRNTRSQFPQHQLDMLKLLLKKKKTHAEKSEYSKHVWCCEISQGVHLGSSP